MHTYTYSFASGIRDIYNSLINDYDFKIKIPNCQQLDKNQTNEKKLTTEQTSNNRIVTKVSILTYKIY